MDSTNVQIHFSCLTQDESKYPAQCDEKGNDKKKQKPVHIHWRC